MIMIRNPFMWLSLAMLKKKWLTVIFFSIIMVSISQNQLYMNPILLIPYFSFISILKMFGADYIGGHEEGLLTIRYTLDTLLTKIVQAVIISSLVISIATSIISIFVMRITGQIFTLQFRDYLFVGSVYFSLFALGRFIGMRMFLLKRKSNLGNNLIEVGYIALLVIMYLILPAKYFLTIIVLGTLLVSYLMHRYLIKNNWKRLLERGV